MGAYIKYVGRGEAVGGGFFRSSGERRLQYFMAQYFFQKIFHSPSHQF